MKKINFFTTTNIFIEDNLNEFTLEEVIRHIKENGSEQRFSSLYNFIKKNAEDKNKIRQVLLKEIPRFIEIFERTINELKEKPGLNYSEIENIILLKALFIMILNKMNSDQDFKII